MVDRNIIRRFSTAGLFLALVAGFAWAQQPPAAPPGEQLAPGRPAPAAELKTSTQIFSYGMGTQFGAILKQQGLTPQQLDFNAMVRGMADSLAGQKPSITQDQMQAAAREVIEGAMQKKLEQLRADPAFQAASAKNTKAGAEFMAANKQKEGVKTLPSGLQYKVLKSGSGPAPTKADAVTAHYHGTLTDGTVFDSSVERNEPATFDVTGVIPGWTEALLLMKEGDKWQLVIPPDLAYGEFGRGEKIGPNSTLVFDVELLKVHKNPGAGQ